MIAAALVTEAQRTEQTLTTLIILLLVVATLMTVLTIWYWVYTSPRRRRRLHQRWLDTSGEIPATAVAADDVLYDQRAGITGAAGANAEAGAGPGHGLGPEVDIRSASGPPMLSPDGTPLPRGRGIDPHEAITQTIPAVGGADRVGQPYRP
ncbi:MAG: hypothetical protein AAF467_13815 [Actinomycetota bacterium]